MCTPLPQFLFLWLLHGDFKSRRVQALSWVPEPSPFPPGPPQPTCSASLHEQQQAHVSLIYHVHFIENLGSMAQSLPQGF